MQMVQPTMSLENLNTKTVKKGDKIVYQVWLDTTNLKASDNIQAVGISDKYEADKLEINVADIKAYDSVTGVDVTDKLTSPLIMELSQQHPKHHLLKISTMIQ